MGMNRVPLLSDLPAFANRPGLSFCKAAKLQQSSQASVHDLPLGKSPETNPSRAVDKWIRDFEELGCDQLRVEKTVETSFSWPELLLAVRREQWIRRHLVELV